MHSRSVHVARPLTLVLNLAAILLLSAIRLQGAEPGESPYPFKANPIDTMAALMGVRQAQVASRFLSKPELALLHDAQNGRLESISLAEALLLASGATDGDDRRQDL